MAFLYRLGDTADEKIGDEARIEVSRPENDEICFFDCQDGIRVCHGIGLERNLSNFEFSVMGGFIDQMFFRQDMAVFIARVEVGIGERHRNNRPVDPEHFTRLLNCFLLRAQYVGKRSHKKVTKRHTGDPLALFEAIHKKLPQKPDASAVFIGKGNHALPDIGSRQKTKFIADPLVASARIAHRHNCTQVIGVLFESAKRHKSSGSAADAHNAFCRCFVHIFVILRLPNAED